VLYFTSCVPCHGADGKGIQAPGTDSRLAPSLADSPRVKGDIAQLVPVLLHGLTGPLDGETYQAGFMAPGAALGLTRDREIAQVISFIRYAWDGKGSPVTEAEGKAIKTKVAARQLPWTQAELEALK
jgi:mono/diheme cytochrome c family protein